MWPWQREQLPSRINHRHLPPKIHKCLLVQETDKEKVFLAQLIDGLEALQSDKLTLALKVESLSQAITSIFSRACLTHSKEFKVSPRSKEYRTDECIAALEEYCLNKTVENHKVFCKAVKAANCKFFDEQIKEIATSNKHP